MKGLLKNNCFATLDNAKAITGLMVLLCVLGIVMKNQSLIISFTLICMVGFSLISLVGSLKERGFKWDKYKLSMPVRRTEIVRSYFLSLLIWLAFGMLLAGIGIGLSLVFRGFLFDKHTDLCLICMWEGSASVCLWGQSFFRCIAHREERKEAKLCWLSACFWALASWLQSAVSSMCASRPR